MGHLRIEIASLDEPASNCSCYNAAIRETVSVLQASQVKNNILHCKIHVGLWAQIK